MFLKIICFYVAVVCAFAAPPTNVVPLEKQQPTVIPIILQSEELEANGTFKYSYETANGIKREETSYDKVLPHAKSASSNEGDSQSDENNEIHVQQGSYSYTAPDGTVITVRYIADENGFRPIGDHLPKPPSILIAASPARIAGRKPKTADNAEVGSAPAAVIAPAPVIKESAEALAVNEASIQSETLKVAPRIAESSAEKASTPASEGSPELSVVTTTDVPSTTEVPSTAGPDLSNTETASTTTKQYSSSEITSTEQPTTETASTSEPSTTEKLASTPADSTPDATTPDATPAASTPDATTPDATPAASTTDASTPEASTSDATLAASTPDADSTDTTQTASTPDTTPAVSDATPA